MNFDPTDEQAMLADSLGRLAQARYGQEPRRRYLAEPGGYSPENWRLLAEMGLLGLSIREGSGGLGGGAADLAAALEAIGYGLMVEPLLVRARAAALLDLSADAALRDRWMSRLVSGAAQLAFADGTAGDLRIKASASADIVSGVIPFVPNAVGADAIIVLAEAAGAPAAWLTPLDRAGVSLRGWRMIDGGYAGALSLKNVAFGPGDRLKVAADLSRWRAETRVAACAEMQGILRRLFEETLSFVKTRRQFGTAIGGFQALQHRMARLYIVLEQGKSLLQRALATPQEEMDAWLRAQESAASYYVRSAVRFAEQCVQMHGGMGVTDELIIGAGLKRLHVLTALAREPRR